MEAARLQLELKRDDSVPDRDYTFIAHDAMVLGSAELQT